MIEYFIGIVKSVNREDKVIHVDIPGKINDVLAYPPRYELDEPKPGDNVIIRCFDPEYFSYQTYEKPKEDDFQGFRLDGKMLHINPDSVTLGVFDTSAEYSESDVPDCNAKVSIKDDKEIDIWTSGDIDVQGENITFRSGTNGGLVNVGFLRDIILAISADLKVAKSGINLDALLGKLYTDLEDTNIKH